METHLKIAGCLLMVLALLHAVFPKYFNWKQELSTLSLVNRQIMFVHSFFIALMVFLAGFLCLSSSGELVHTAFGRKICIGLGLFWTARLFVQFFGYSPKIWKGKKFETTIHLLLSVFWAYLSTVFMLVYFQ